MNSVVVANGDVDELKAIETLLNNDFNVNCISTKDGLFEAVQKADALVLDHNFTQESGIDILMEVLPKIHLPILFVATPDYSKMIIEAMRLGAYNYVFKTDNYQEIIGYSVKEMMDKFYEKAELKRTILALKERVAELEKKLGLGTGTGADESQDSSPAKAAATPKKANLLEEITARFKRGEINLPSYPDINIRFREMIKSGANVAEISRLLKKDMGISSKLISMSNTAHYRGMQENKTLEQAVSRLGLSETKNCVEMISNRSLFTTQNKKFCESLDDLWRHSLSCAHTSEFISRRVNLKSKEEVFTLGLLHDIGKLFLLQVVAELEVKGVFGDEIDQTELELTLNAKHGAFGAALMKRWQFSQKYSEICLYHNDLSGADSVSKELLIVNLANLIVKSLGYGGEVQPDLDLKGEPSSKFLKIDLKDITKIKEQVVEVMESGLVE